MTKSKSDFDLQRAVRQQLDSLNRSGVMQLRRCEPIEAQQPESSGPTAASSTATTANSETPAAPSSVTEQTAPSPPTVAPSQPAAPQPTADAATRNFDRSKKLSKNERIEGLEILDAKVKDCTLCSELASTRTQTVFGVGNPNARVVFFGEAPGADEDAQGEPFVGRAGKLLTKIIEACGFTRDDVYIMNTLKCRPPGNRNPAPDEVTNCRPFYERQLEIIQPEFIVCLGSIAATNVLQTTLAIGKLRGDIHDLNGIKVVATYHPAYLLRNPSAKKYVWDDMKMLLTEMGLPIPASG